MQEMNFNQTQPTQPDFKPAPVPERLLAFLIDFMPFYIVPLFLFLYSGKAYSYGGALGLFLISFGIFIVYTAIFNSGNRQTLGKWLMGIKVVSSKDPGDGINIIKGLLRSICYILSSALCFAGFALAVIAPKKRALHDFMSGSMVISVREKTQTETMVIMFLSSIISGALVAMTFFYTFKAQPSEQRALVVRAQKQINAIAFLQEVHMEKYGGYTSDLVRLALISGDSVQLRRDIQRNLRRSGFKMGATRKTYKITAVAKDNKNTKVTVENF